MEKKEGETDEGAGGGRKSERTGGSRVASETKSRGIKYQGLFTEETERLGDGGIGGESPSPGGQGHGAEETVVTVCDSRQHERCAKLSNT